MKKFFFTLTLLVFVLNMFSQATTNSNATKENYLIKSKNQKKVAKILLFGGATFVLIAFLIPRGEVQDAYFFTTYENDGIKGAFGVVGTTSMLCSIPLFIASSRNKRKAAAITMGFKNEKILNPQSISFLLKSQPTITLRMGL